MHTERILEFILSPFAWLWRRHERAVLCNGGDKISKVVISKWVLRGEVFKCHHEGEWIGMMHPEDWKILKESMPEKPIENLPSSPNSLNGVPVVVDDELGYLILIEAISTVPKLEEL